MKLKQKIKQLFCGLNHHEYIEEYCFYGVQILTCEKCGKTSTGFTECASKVYHINSEEEAKEFIKKKQKENEIC